MKPTIPTGTMSNLVGMWALKTENDRILNTFFISGKCGSSNDGNDYYILQVISPIDGVPNVAKVVRLTEIMQLLILPSKEVAEIVIDDYYKKDTLRYQFPKL